MLFVRLVVRCSNKLRPQRAAYDFTVCSSSTYSDYFLNILQGVMYCLWTRLLKCHRGQLSIWRSAGVVSSRGATLSHQSPGRWSAKLSLTLCISIYYHSSTLAQLCASLCLLRVQIALFLLLPSNHFCFPKKRYFTKPHTDSDDQTTFYSFSVCAHFDMSAATVWLESGDIETFSSRTNRRLFDCRALIWPFVLVCDLFGLTTSRFAASLSHVSMKVCR